MIQHEVLIGISEKEEIASNELIKFLNIISVLSRYKIILLLYKNTEISVSDISVFLKISQPAISQHLKVLKLSNIVKTRKSGREIFYSLDNLGLTTNYKNGIDLLRTYFKSEGLNK